MGFENEGRRYILDSPTTLPNASAFLWNPKMLLQATCRGFASSQFLQPEPSPYVSGPALQAQTFMQPEQPYYAHHPGRFFYIKDEQTGQIFSVPYEPARAQFDSFAFHCEPARLSWTIECLSLRVTMQVHLDVTRPLECWEISLENLTDRSRSLSIYPYFPVGYRSWMNQSAEYDTPTQAIVCHAIAPYQKVEQYFANKGQWEYTFLLSDVAPKSWETRQSVFEGEGGLHCPSGVVQATLDNGSAHYQIPACVMQFNIELPSKGSHCQRFLFGPAPDLNYIKGLQQEFFSSDRSAKSFADSYNAYSDYVGAFDGMLSVETPNQTFNHFVNHWLSRQLYYHGDVNRLTTDPQTRNYLQDNMGLCYLNPVKARQAFLHALAQQHHSGEMPDGILLYKDAVLKYINQVPHTDHCVWLPMFLQVYLAETADYDLLNEPVGFADSEAVASVFEHVELAMKWLEHATDERGLSYINQGDWCDPMNMVGYRGRGVSAWLTLASAYAFKIWSEICQQVGNAVSAQHWEHANRTFNDRVKQYFYCGKWFARGITDSGRVFGIESDEEGKMFLNPQTFAMLSEAVNRGEESQLIELIQTHLMTPYGPTMLAPAYTHMDEDIGRVTQKFPGTAENGSVYNHAAAFYAFALFDREQTDLAIEVLQAMLPTDSDMSVRGQLPVFIPNYYRGAYHQFPADAGKSSHLFNTGTVAWFYRCVVEGLLGLKGCPQGLLIQPQLPKNWPEIKAVRVFRGAFIHLHVRTQANRTERQVLIDGMPCDDHVLVAPQSGRHYQVIVELPS